MLLVKTELCFNMWGFLRWNLPAFTTFCLTYTGNRAIALLLWQARKKKKKLGVLRCIRVCCKWVFFMHNSSYQATKMSKYCVKSDLALHFFFLPALIWMASQCCRKLSCTVPHRSQATKKGSAALFLILSLLPTCSKPCPRSSGGLWCRGSSI